MSGHQHWLNRVQFLDHGVPSCSADRELREVVRGVPAQPPIVPRSVSSFPNLLPPPNLQRLSSEMPPASIPSPTRHYSTVSEDSLGSTTSRRTVAPKVKDFGLVDLARRTRRKVQWNRILRDSNPSAAQWKWLENVRNFSIYTKQDSTKEFSVLAIGVVKGSVQEIASLLVSSSQRAYVQKMEALYEKGFKHGMYLNDVTYEPEEDEVGEQHDIQLSVRTATFEKPSNWFSSNDEWCFLDRTSYNRETQRLEKQLTTLQPDDMLSIYRDSIGSSVSGNTKHFRDVTIAFRAEPDQTENSEVPPGMEDGRASPLSPGRPPRVATRIHFFGEHDTTNSRERVQSRLGRLSISKANRSASDKAVRQRLLYLAKGCDRLSHLVRRRRLGMQVLVDQKRFLQAFSTRCFCCDKSLGVIAKVCRVCGQGVCGDCSAKYERETHTQSSRSGGRIRLESVRVCDPCLARVEVADYSAIDDQALSGPAVIPNRPGDKPASADLKDLLNDALLTAPSPQRKGAVMSVIRCLLDQETESTPPTTPSPLGSINEEHDGKRAFVKQPAVLLTPVSTDKEYVNALDYLDVKTIRYSDAEISAADGRAYPMDSRTGTPDEHMTFPRPSNEAERLAAIEYTQALAMGGTYEELNIICEIAAKEIGSFASLVSIITADEQRVIGANMDFLTELVLKREDAFCAHAIMDDKPLLVPHPESDIRFSKIIPVTALGARYYCGFPLVADDEHKTVLGSLCCIDKKPNELTESQYSVLRRLSEMAAKVVRIEGEKRRRSASSRSSNHGETRDL